MGYSNEQLEAIAAKLKTMPVIEKKKQEHSKQDAVKVLSKEIALLQKRGYTLDQIAETLRGEGLDITTPTLKSYLQRIKAGKNKGLKEPDNVQKKDTQKEHKMTLTPEHKKPADTDQSESSSKAAFTPKPDSDDI
ncbi:Protein MobC [Candidatus Methylobacter favarea]|uniref:Protein MobC n=1 Tax=Candidatus Methylobacter favarea TaxID=2707345 RepID=A0A8S0WCJ6_9GAMM|nr:protein mobC [Candidatus Methylobacter favarea]CAA9892575.1 Protein MobC [Candidatus Methylobacter favarea]